MSILTKYRPTTLRQVIGHKAAVRSLESALDNGECRAFLLEGPSGVGKTTLARIIASRCGDGDYRYQELDAPSCAGVEDARELVRRIYYSPLGHSGTALCIDEAHALSQAAWQAVLKSVEDPPPNFVWLFTTTQPRKVPRALRTRCAVYTLSLVSDKDLRKLISDVAKKEEIALSDDILDLLIEYSEGSPRMALSGLGLIRGIEDEEEVEELLKLEAASENAIGYSVARALCKSSVDWADLYKMLRDAEKLDSESVRRTVCAYFSKVAMSARGAKQAHSLSILSAFAEPYTTPDVHHLLLSLGEIQYE